MSALRSSILRTLRVSDPTPDAVLLRAAAACETDAFPALVARHGPMVLRVCRQILGDEHAAEDAFQAVFLVLSRRAGTLKRPERLAAWLFGTARNVALRAKRAIDRRKRRERHATARDIAAPSAELTARELLAALDEEIERLPEVNRLPLILCFWQGLTQDQAAQRLGWTPGSVKGRLERSRKLLAARLTKRGLAPAALLAAALTPTTVPAELLASTAALAAPGAIVPATVLALAAGGTTKLLGGATLSVLIAGVGFVALAAGFASPQPPVAPKPPVTLPTPAPPVDALGDPLPAGAVARLGTTRFRHGQWITAIAFAPDGELIASGSADFTIRLWDRTTGREVRRLIGHTDQVRHVSFSADGKQLVSVGGGWHLRNADSSIRLWDVVTGREIAKLVEHDSAAMKSSIARSPDGKVLAFGVDRVLRLLSVPSGQQLADLALPNLNALQSDGPLKGSCFSPDGTRIAAIVASVGVCLFDVRDRSLVWTNSEQSTGALSSDSGLVFTPDGKGIVVATSVRQPLRMLDAATGRVVRTFEAPPNGSGPLLISNDGRKLISKSWEKSGLIWDLTTGRPTGQLHPRAGDMMRLAQSPDGRTLAIAGQRSIRLHDMATGKLILSPEGAAGPIDRITIIAGGTSAMTGSYWDDASGVRIWDLQTNRLRLAFEKAATCFALSPDGQTFAAGYFNKPPEIVDLKTGVVIRACAGPGDLFLDSLAFANDGKSLIGTGWFAQPIRLWNVENGNELKPLGMLPKDGGAKCIAVAPDGKRLATGGMDRIVRIWDIAGRQQTRELSGYGGAIMALAWSPDGEKIAVASRAGHFNFSAGDHDRAVQVWNVATGDVLARFEGPPDGNWCVAWSPDGRTLAAGGEDGVIRVWEMASGKARTELRGHEGPVSALAFADNGGKLISGSSDTTSLVWKLWSARRAPASFDDAWTILASGDAAQAFEAMTEAAQIDGVASFLESKLKPVEPADTAILETLITDLSSDQFAVREKATAALRRFGELASRSLQEARDKTQSAETKRRATLLLEELERVPQTADMLRSLRAIEILERVGSQDALKLLAKLANGAPAARVTIDAKASLARLGAK